MDYCVEHVLHSVASSSNRQVLFGRMLHNKVDIPQCPCTLKYVLIAILEKREPDTKCWKCYPLDSGKGYDVLLIRSVHREI